MAYPESQIAPTPEDILHGLQNQFTYDRVNMPETDAARLLEYNANHAAYLTDIASAVEEQLGTARYIEDDLDALRPTVFERSRLHGQTFDLAALGLPEPEVTEYAGRPLMPFAVLIHRTAPEDSHRPADVRGIELLSITHDNILCHHFLQNIPVAVRGDGEPERAPRWLPTGNAHIIFQPTDVRVSESGPEGARMLRLDAVPHQAKDGMPAGTTTIIQPKLTATEKRVLTGDRKGHKISASVAALGMAGLAVGAPIGGGEDPHKNQPLKMASQVVRPKAEVSYMGVNQAENLFDEPTLDRSRSAIAAYMHHDRAALETLATQQQYESDWMPPSALEAIQAATNFRELEAAFQKAFGEVPIRLSVLDTAAKSTEMAAAVSDAEISPARDFAAAKQLALASAQLFNMYDKKWLLTQQEPLEIDIVHTAQILQNEGIKYAAADGFYAASTDVTQPNRIFLADSTTTPKSELIAHEETHEQDAEQANSFSNDVLQVDAPRHLYSGDDAYDGTSTYVYGWHNATESYSNANIAEDAATIGQRLLLRVPKIRFENSPWGEKETAIIFAMEAAMPGFTAKMLLRARPYEPGSGPSTFERLLFERNQIGADILAGSLLLLAAASAGGLATERRRRQVRRLAANSIVIT